MSFSQFALRYFQDKSSTACQHKRGAIKGPLLKQIWGDQDTERVLTVWYTIQRFMGDLPPKDNEETSDNLQRVQVRCFQRVVLCGSSCLSLFLASALLLRFALQTHARINTDTHMNTHTKSHIHRHRHRHTQTNTHTQTQTQAQTQTHTRSHPGANTLRAHTAAGLRDGNHKGQHTG